MDIYVLASSAEVCRTHFKVLTPFASAQAARVRELEMRGPGAGPLKVFRLDFIEVSADSVPSGSAETASAATSTKQP